MPGHLKESRVLHPDFRDMLSAFCTEKVDFMLVGGYALAAHGYPRATGDIDLWIRCSDENAQSVWRALVRFGVPLFDLTIDDLKTSGIVFQVGVVPNRIDIITAIDGVNFDEAKTECKIVEIEGLEIPVISRSHLLKNKKATGRPKDQADVIWLESSEE
jgi:hypothetical protein